MSVRCRESLGALSEYLDGELEAAFCAEIEEHLEHCGDCRILVDTLRQTITLYRTLGHETLPPEARARLYEALNLPCKP